MQRSVVAKPISPFVSIQTMISRKLCHARGYAKSLLQYMVFMGDSMPMLRPKPLPADSRFRSGVPWWSDARAVDGIVGDGYLELAKIGDH